MSTIAHDYCDIIDGPIYETIRHDHKWYSVIADCIPDETATLTEIGSGARLSIDKGPTCRVLAVECEGVERYIERKKIYVRIRISNEAVLAENADAIRTAIHDSWRSVGEAIRARNPDACAIHAHASTIGLLYAGTHRIFVSPDADEFNILGACYYFAIPEGAKTASDR